MADLHEANVVVDGLHTLGVQLGEGPRSDALQGEFLELSVKSREGKAVKIVPRGEDADLGFRPLEHLEDQVVDLLAPLEDSELWLLHSLPSHRETLPVLDDLFLALLHARDLGPVLVYQEA